MSTNHQIADVADRSFARSAAARLPAAHALTAAPERMVGEACGATACGPGCRCGSASTPDPGPAIACTLDAARLGTRVDEWAALLDGRDDMLAGVVARTAIEDGVRLHLGPETDVSEVARLAVAEQDCCRFFRFALLIDTRGVTLEVRAPAEAIDIVTALFGAPA